jgi:hypothetical protein
MDKEKTGANPFMEALEKIELERHLNDLQWRADGIRQINEREGFNITGSLLYPYEKPITLLDVYHMTPAEVMFTASRGTKIIK